MKKQDNFELLAPAGNIDSFKAACIGGADAIYMGLSKFNARNMAENFDLQSYIDCIEYAHFRGVKVYLTLNTLMNNSELEEALELLIRLYSKGLDAVIVQDIGLATIIHKIIPDLPLHASTQMSIYSLDQVKFLESMGFKRVVLARELSIDEIKNICLNTNLEIEVFVHGALCVSVSGQCLLSGTIGNRSANKGTCAQPCRMKYSLCDIAGNKVIQNQYLLSKKDIYGIGQIKELKEAGVYSFKIEGRNKTPEYVLGVTKMYRKYIDNNQNITNTDKYVLKQLFNRNGLSEGYLNGVSYKESITTLSPKNTGVYLGKVISVYKNYIKIKLRQEIDLHDGIEIYSGEDVISNIVTCIKDEKGKIVNEKVGIGESVYLGDFKTKVKVGSKVFKTSSNALNKSLRDEYTRVNKRQKIQLEISVLSNKKISIHVKKLNINIIYDYIPQIANKKELTQFDIEEAFSKTLDEPFDFEGSTIKLDKKIFVPISVLNDIRRNTVERIKKTLKIDKDISKVYSKLNDLKDEIKENILNLENVNNKENSYFIYKYNKDVNYIDMYIQKYNLKPDIIYINFLDFYKNKEEILNKYKLKIDIYLYLPNYVGPNLNKIIKQNIEEYLKEGIKGFLLGGFEYYNIIRNLRTSYNFKIIADYSFNITNIVSAYFMQNIGFDKITPSVELELSEYMYISKKICSEAVTDIVTTMTSRYCILGSFIGGKSKFNSCSHPCKKSYYLKDMYRI